MRLIAHRGNLNGPNPLVENDPQRITYCIDEGYDEPQHKVNWFWIAGRRDRLWIHCKDVATLHEFSTKTSGYNFFFHDKDDYTLTSKQYIWAYPGKSYTDHTVMVMPEWKEDVDWDTLRATNCFGICTDYPQRLI
mgnify:FL=1